MTIYAATGHRPNKLGGYGEHVYKRLTSLAERFLGEQQPDKVISGMALGWDMAWANAAWHLGIPFIAAAPFKGQESRWPEESQIRYKALLAVATEVIIVCDGEYAAWKMQKRNEWMVDKADGMVALWDGSTGGTGNCVRYAEKVGKPIVNLWDRWNVVS